MARFYITMRLKQFWRFFRFNQFNPVIGIALLSSIFILLSLLVFEKTKHAAWLYPALAFISIMELQPARSNEFFKTHARSTEYYWGKLTENLLLALPFIMVLLAKQYYIQPAVLLLVQVPYSFFNFSIPKPKLKALRSPFPAHTIEWHNNYRTFSVIYLLHLILLLPGVISGNFYVFLAPFFLLLFFINTTYGIIEDNQLVWVYRCNANQFLLKKLKSLAISYTICFVVFIITGLIFYHQHMTVLMLCIIAGFISVAGSLLMKYHFYPSEFIIQLSQVIFLILCIGSIVNPSLLILVALILIFSFFKARKNLKTILQC